MGWNLLNCADCKPAARTHCWTAALRRTPEIQAFAAVAPQSTPTMNAQ
jgi:hypothetical protein